MIAHPSAKNGTSPLKTTDLNICIFKEGNATLWVELKADTTIALLTENILCTSDTYNYQSLSL